MEKLLGKPANIALMVFKVTKCVIYALRHWTGPQRHLSIMPIFIPNLRDTSAKNVPMIWQIRLWIPCRFLNTAKMSTEYPTQVGWTFITVVRQTTAPLKA